jgi:hypothetical protein
VSRSDVAAVRQTMGIVMTHEWLLSFKSSNKVIAVTKLDELFTLPEPYLSVLEKLKLITFMCISVFIAVTMTYRLYIVWKAVRGRSTNYEGRLNRTVSNK